MEVSTLSTPTQIILAWTLLGVLLSWLVIFATLALRNRRIEPVDLDELPTPAGSFPAINMQVIRQQSTPVQVGVPVSNAPRSATPVSSHSGRGLLQTDHSD